MGYKWVVLPCVHHRYVSCRSSYTRLQLTAVQFAKKWPAVNTFTWFSDRKSHILTQSSKPNWKESHIAAFPQEHAKGKELWPRLCVPQTSSCIFWIRCFPGGHPKGPPPGTVQAGIQAGLSQYWRYSRNSSLKNFQPLLPCGSFSGPQHESHHSSCCRHSCF